jgi:aminopeptidase N
MRLFLFSVVVVMTAGFAIAQPDMRSVVTDFSWRKIYRATPAKEFDLIHTKIDVRFDYAKHRMPGKVWLTLKPHILPKDSLVLDAKGMLINQVSLLRGTSLTPLTFTYPDTLQLRIALGKMYKPTEQLTVYIEYVAKPDEMTFKGSAAIRNAKGLYFINPDGKDKAKPIQIWTQGETEATSVWLPILDKTNQKTTQEIYMTVPAKYVTLSNGLLKSSKVNKNGIATFAIPVFYGCRRFCHYKR